MKRATLITQIYDEVAQISPSDAKEQACIAETLAWIKDETNIFRIAPPDKPPKHLVSYFVLIDPVQHSLLLGDHIKAGLWLPSGGHVEFGEHPRETVVRESIEELGQKAVFLRGNDHPFFITASKTTGTVGVHVDVSLWYLLRGSIHDSINFERREFNNIAWFPFAEILESHPAIFDPEMQRFTQKLSTYLD